MSKWSDIKMYDLTIPIGICTPAWPTYEPLQMKFFKRLTPNGANGQLLTHSNHVGTHLDGPLHFDTAGRDIASIELTRLCRPGAVVATGGGAHSPFWLNLKRERLGINIFPAACPEPACRGAALLAAQVAPGE